MKIYAIRAEEFGYKEGLYTCEYVRFYRDLKRAYDDIETSEIKAKVISAVTGVESEEYINSWKMELDMYTIHPIKEHKIANGFDEIIYWIEEIEVEE